MSETARRYEPTPETVARRCLRVARHALSKSDVLTVDVGTVATSSDFRDLMKMLEGMARPFAVWVVRHE